MNRGRKNRHYKARRRAAGLAAFLAWGRRALPKDAEWCDGCRDWIHESCTQCFAEQDDESQCVLERRL